MYKSLPPLQLLTAFEAAHRLRSFKDAAAELHVTPSAVSQQIRALEDALGVSLFDRRPREITPTQVGSKYVETVREVLGMLDRDTRRLRSGTQQQILRVSTDAFIVHEYIVPAIAEFRERVPGVDLRVESSSALVDMKRASIDAAIGFHAEPPADPGLTSRLLQRQTVLLVAAPQLARELRTKRDLATSAIICIEDRFDNTWGPLACCLELELSPRSILWLDSYYATIRAAERGQGVAIAMRPCVDPWLSSGRLTELPGTSIEDAHAFYLVCREADATRPEMIAFAAWAEDLFQRGSGDGNDA